MTAGRVGLGPVKRYGVRYGRTVKARLAAIEVDQKKAQQCPYCKKMKAYRLSFGIYQCDLCDKKFTGQAYSLAHVVTRIETAAPVEAQEEA